MLLKIGGILMALIKCPECDKDISDRATSCIHCGCPIKNSPPISETRVTISNDGVKNIISSILVVLTLVMTIYENHFQSEEIIYTVRMFSGGSLAYLAMILCVIAAILYALPVKKAFKASCVITTIYSLIISLSQLFVLSIYSFAPLLTIVAVLTYTVIYWMSACGSFKNATPIIVCGVCYLACTCIEAFFATRYGTNFTVAFYSTRLPTILYYTGSLLYIKPIVSPAYMDRKARLDSALTQYQIEIGHVQDAPSTGFAILCFCFPIVGLILYCVWRETLPQRAKSAGIGGLLGFVIGVVLTVIVYVIILSGM